MERRADATQTPIVVGEPNHLYTSKRLRIEILARTAGVAGGLQKDAGVQNVEGRCGGLRYLGIALFGVAIFVVFCPCHTPPVCSL